MITKKELLDQFQLKIGTASTLEADDIWRVPVLGHALIVSEDGCVRTELILCDDLDFGDDIFDLDDDEEVKHVIPALPGEHVIKCCVPDNCTVEQIRFDESYNVKIITLCHNVPGISEQDWEPLFREKWLSGVRDDESTEQQ